VLSQRSRWRWSNRDVIMATENDTRRPLEQPLAELERHLIHAYLAGAGYDFHTLVSRDDAEARRLLAAASQYASSKLTEAEARWRYVRSLHGEPT
jgi:hypothetical protein